MRQKKKKRKKKIVVIISFVRSFDRIRSHGARLMHVRLFRGGVEGFFFAVANFSQSNDSTSRDETVSETRGEEREAADREFISKRRRDSKGRKLETKVGPKSKLDERILATESSKMFPSIHPPPLPPPQGASRSSLHAPSPNSIITIYYYLFRYFL